MNKSVFFSLAIGFSLCVSPVVGAAHGATEAEVRAVLQRHPELILNVLKSHPEEVLDIVQDGANKKREKSQMKAWEKDIDIPKYLNTNGRLMRGNASAPVTIIVFSDFTCPFCKRANVTIQKILKERPNDVRYLFKYFPAEDTPASNLASEYFVAASFQSSEKAWVLYDLLFEANERINNDPENLLPALAEKAGLDMQRLRKDLKSGKKIREIMDLDIAEANAQQVEGTPVLFVNNLVLRGTPSEEQLNRAVDLAKSRAGKTKKK